MRHDNPSAGVGDPLAQFRVYMGNRPDFPSVVNLTPITPLTAGQLHLIGQACGNGWRKVFNVYAKLVFALSTDSIVSLQGRPSWQDFRTHTLLQASSNTSLLFSAPELHGCAAKGINIIMGKAYATSLRLAYPLYWFDREFAVNLDHRTLICPYFDYRQLSNIKIIRLAKLIKDLDAGKLKF